MSNHGAGNVYMAALAAMLALGAFESQAATSIGKVGTLTCTTEEVGRQSNDSARLACHFLTSSGQAADFTGYLARKGPAELPAGKRVLIWSVLAPPGDLEVGALAGEYKGRIGGRSRGRLVGGKSGSIILEPATAGRSQIGVSVLRLQLQPIRV